MEAKTINLNERKLEKEHIKFVKGDVREIIAKAIEDSFNKALEVYKKDDNFKVDGQQALMAIEERILTHYSRKIVGSAINGVTGLFDKIANKE